MVVVLAKQDQAWKVRHHRGDDGGDDDVPSKTGPGLKGETSQGDDGDDDDDDGGGPSKTGPGLKGETLQRG